MAVVYINYNMCADLDCCVLYQRLFAITKAKSLLLLFEVGVYLTCSFTSLFLHSSVQSSSMCMFCSFCIHLSSLHPCVCFVLSAFICPVFIHVYVLFFLHSSVQSSSMCMFCSFCIHLSSLHPCVCFVLSAFICPVFIHVYVLFFLHSSVQSSSMCMFCSFRRGLCHGGIIIRYCTACTCSAV